MIKENKTGIILIVTGAFLFNILFWQELIAVNILFFDLFIVSCLVYLYPSSKKQAGCQIYPGGTCGLYSYRHRS